MNKIKVHPYLIARLRAVQDAFAQPYLSPAFSLSGTKAESTPKKGNAWEDIIKKEEESGDQGGGRGTIKGLRQKDAEKLKNAMRKLSRR